MDVLITYLGTLVDRPASKGQQQQQQHTWKLLDKYTHGNTAVETLKTIEDMKLYRFKLYSFVL